MKVRYLNAIFVDLPIENQSELWIRSASHSDHRSGDENRLKSYLNACKFPFGLRHMAIGIKSICAATCLALVNLLIYL